MSYARITQLVSSEAESKASLLLVGRGGTIRLRFLQLFSFSWIPRDLNPEHPHFLHHLFFFFHLTELFWSPVVSGAKNYFTFSELYRWKQSANLATELLQRRRLSNENT